MNNPPDFIHLFIRQFWRILMDYPSVVWKRSMIEWLDNRQFDYQQSKRYNCDKIFIDLANNITASHWPISSITNVISQMWSTLFESEDEPHRLSKRQ